MSPFSFNLLIDRIILHINSLLPTQEFNALFTFIDDIALETKSPRTLHRFFLLPVNRRTPLQLQNLSFMLAKKPPM